MGKLAKTRKRSPGEETHSCSFRIDAVLDEGVDDVRDRVGRELLVPKSVEDSKSKLVGFRNRRSREEVEDAL